MTNKSKTENTQQENLHTNITQKIVDNKTSEDSIKKVDRIRPTTSYENSKAKRKGRQ